MTNDKIGLKNLNDRQAPSHYTQHNTITNQRRALLQRENCCYDGYKSADTLGEHSTGDNCHVSRESDFNMQIHGPCSSHRMAIGDMDTWKFRAVNVEGGLLWSGGHLIEAH